MKNGRKWIGLDEVMGDCRHCIHQDECAPLKQHVHQEHLNGNYRFRCPILIEVDENIEYSKGLEEAKKREYTTKKDKNNKEIHNGDWLKWNNDFYWVNWDEFNGCWYGEPHIDNINRGILTAPSFKDCEIVGNKLVNPEIGNIIVNPEQVWNGKEWVKI